MSVELELIEPCWINGKSDDSADLCAHGKINFQIDGEKLVDASEEFTVSAASLFLLRSIFSDHTLEKPVAEGNVLFPCCGFTAWESASNYPVIIMGCPSGVDMIVTHSSGSVTIATESTTKSISKESWVKSVLGFANQVLNFYSLSIKKIESINPEDQKGWQLFWKEFHELKKRAETAC
jgi:hypothetical protein